MRGTTGSSLLKDQRVFRRVGLLSCALVTFFWRYRQQHSDNDPWPLAVASMSLSPAREAL